MAVTVSGLASGVPGNHRYIYATITLDGALSVWTTGLNNIVGVAAAIGSAVSGGLRFQPNQLSAGTASPGSLAIRSGTTGDEVHVMVYGN